MINPKVLLIDIETLADQAWVWGHYEQNVIRVIRHGHLLTVAWKWLGGKAKVRGQCDYAGYKKKSDNDKALCKELFALLDKADCVVAHNGNSFDIKKINARFLVNSIPPPSPYLKIDTLLEYRKTAKFESNKLDDLGEQLKLGRKVTHEGWALWEGCYEGKPESWRKMKKYNLQDVLLLEKALTKIWPWIQDQPRIRKLLKV